MTAFDKASLLVTGASGFIGRRLAERLLSEGRSVRLLARNPARLSAVLRAGCDVVVGDLEDRAVLQRALRGVDVVFHCAANVSTWDSWESYHAANVDGVENLLQAMACERPPMLRLVHISTVDVYGFPVEPCIEESPTSSTNFGYGRTKFLGEQLVRKYCERIGIPYTVIRPGNVIGPGSQFIVRIGDALKSGLMLKVDDGRANAGLVYIDNLVEQIIWAAQAEVAVGQCYNVRDPYDISWAQFIERLRAAIGGRGLVVNMPFSMADLVARGFELIYHACLPGREPLLHRLLVRIFGRSCGHSAEKIQTHSGYVGKVGLDEAIDISARWYLQERSSSRE